MKKVVMILIGIALLALAIGGAVLLLNNYYQTQTPGIHIGGGQTGEILVTRKTGVIKTGVSGVQVSSQMRSGLAKGTILGVSTPAATVARISR